MITINLSSNVAEVTAKLRKDLQRQVPFAASRAINELAFDTREFIKDQMDVYYEGGAVSYTKNAIFSTKSTKRDLVATVFVGGKDEHRINYILNTIDGGTATPRKKALTDPVGKNISLTAKGLNIPRYAIGRMLAKPGYFVHEFNPKRRKNQKTPMPTGVYYRSKKGGKMTIKLMVVFKKEDQHIPSFPIRLPARKFVNRHFKPLLMKYLKQAIASRK